MKRSIFVLLLTVVFNLSFMTAYADDVSVLINGEILKTDEAPQIINDRTMLPMRAIFEKLGARVTWIQEEKMIFATKDDVLITMQIANPMMSVQRIGVNENTAIPLDTAPYVCNDRTFVPVRAIAEALDAKVDWDGESRMVIINLE